MTRSNLRQNEWTRWCFDTCLLFGCEPAAAARIAALFSDAIRKDAHA